MNINIFLRNTIRFVVFVLLQILVFNHIEIASIGVIPVFFILFVLLLPYETPDWVLISTSFLIGFIVDFFSDSLGLYAASTVFMAFIRPTVLRSLSPRDGYEASTYPRVYYMGIVWFLKYASIMIFAHQLFYYIIVDSSTGLRISTIIKIFLGTLIAMLLVIISQYLIYRKQ